MPLWGASGGGITEGTTAIAGGTDQQVQFNDNGVINGSTSFTFNKTTKRLVVGFLAFALTTAAGLELNSLTTTQQNALSTPTAGSLIWNSTIGAPSWYSGSAWQGLPPVTAPAASTFQLGAADVDTGPVAQTFRTQGALAGGTSNVAGANWTFIASPGKGTGVGGSFIFQTTPAGSTGTVVGTPTTALTIDSTQKSTFAGVTRITNTGGSTNLSLAVGSSNNTGLYSRFGARLDFTAGGTDILELFDAGSTGGVAAVLNAGAPLCWSSSGISGAQDLYLYRDAANTLALRNSTTAQKLSVYNTFTDASNYERGIFDWSTSANVLTIGVQGAGTGTSTRNIVIVAGGSTIVTFNGSSLLTALGGSFNVPNGNTIFWATRTAIQSAADGDLTLSTNGGGAFGSLKFGGTTSSFPALKRSGTILQARLADDSGDATLECGVFKLNQTPAAVSQAVDTTINSGADGAGNIGHRVSFNANGTTYWIPCSTTAF